MERAIPWGVLAVLMAAACFWRPRPMRGVIGVFFAIMGLGVHGTFVLTNPEGYVQFARQALLPFYAELAEAVVVGMTPVVFGVAMLIFEATLAALILSKGKWVTASLLIGIGFLVGITPLGVEVLPNAILAVGLWRLAREDYPATAVGELRAWWTSRKKVPSARGLVLPRRQRDGARTGAARDRGQE